MPKIASKHVDEETGEQVVYIEVDVDGLEELQEQMIRNTVEELMRYVLRMKGIESDGCGGCAGC